jgi:hypothetical protein
MFVLVGVTGPHSVLWDPFPIGPKAQGPPTSALPAVYQLQLALSSRSCTGKLCRQGEPPSNAHLYLSTDFVVVAPPTGGNLQVDKGSKFC